MSDSFLVLEELRISTTLFEEIHEMVIFISIWPQVIIYGINVDNLRRMILLRIFALCDVIGLIEVYAMRV